MHGSSSNYESSGVIYSAMFKNNEARIKTLNGSDATYWMRTAYSKDNMEFRIIRVKGTSYYANANSLNGIAIGFCLGLEPETITDSWETILANENPSSTYSIGDTKYLDLGTEGNVLMEIVAFDTDDKADGSGKAKITWISKGLLNTKRIMNSPATTTGGWENSRMRTHLRETIKPLIPETVRNAIVPVTKIQSTYVDGAKVVNGQTTTDDVWIPSHHEVLSTSSSYESTGPAYIKFSANTDRTKKHSGSVTDWWLRSVSSGAKWANIDYSGTIKTNNANLAYGVALGFCT